MITPEQRKWLEANKPYEAVGKPSNSTRDRFTQCGTLYADGRFVLLQSMQPVKLEPGCFAVGIRQQ